MKHFFLALFIISMTLSISAQVKIGSNTDNIHPASILELESDNKGFLISRLSDSAIRTIESPPEGLIVYNNDLKCLQINTGTSGSPKWSSMAVVEENKNTGALVLPVGTDAQRPKSPVEGMLRYNTTASQFEAYKQGRWMPL